MENFDLNAYGVSEMNPQEMLMIDGGNIFGDIWNAIRGAAEWIWGAICDALGLWNTIIDTISDMEIVFKAISGGFTISFN